MGVKTLCFKENEGIVHNPIGQLSSVPWWNAFGSHQSVYSETCDNLFKLNSSMEKSTAAGEQFNTFKLARSNSENCLEKGNSNTIQFTVFPDNCKANNDGQKSPQTVVALPTVLPEYRAQIEMGFGQPLICAKYPNIDDCYGLFSTYGSQIQGRVMLPMNMATDNGMIFVNPKQYNGILRRRKSRAKAELENRAIKKRKPYMHLSRHLHALRRPRGSGGRFLNSGNGKDGTVAKKSCDIPIFQPTGSQSSEVLQSDSGTFNSSKEANGGGCNVSGNEATSVYSRRDLDHFSINQYSPSVHSFSMMMDNRHSNVMPSKWVATTDYCCNLKN